MENVQAGYRYAIDAAIAFACSYETSRYWEGQAAGLQIWACAASNEQWVADKRRIAEARECATTTDQTTA